MKRALEAIAFWFSAYVRFVAGASSSQLCSDVSEAVSVSFAAVVWEDAVVDKVGEGVVQLIHQRCAGVIIHAYRTNAGIGTAIRMDAHTCIHTIFFELLVPIAGADSSAAFLRTSCRPMDQTFCLSRFSLLLHLYRCLLEVVAATGAGSPISLRTI